jgi:hypothetical protein
VNEREPFTAADLEELHTELFSRAERVIPMRDVFKGDTGPRVLGLRHDVDDNPGSFATALRMAEWEFEHGYSSTYFLLHGSHYWDQEWLCAVPRFEELGHEVGIHVNAIAEGLRLRQDPRGILAEAISDLRATGVKVHGCVAHGDALCRKAEFVNDELFAESQRPDMGAPDRMIEHDGVVYPLEPISRKMYGLEYDANWLSRGDYLSDSGGEWSQSFAEVVERFGSGQLHMLVHPDWWREAFVTEAVAA